MLLQLNTITTVDLPLGGKITGRVQVQPDWRQREKGSIDKVVGFNIFHSVLVFDNEDM
jgi:hypothetical protein